MSYTCTQTLTDECREIHRERERTAVGQRVREERKVISASLFACPLALAITCFELMTRGAEKERGEPKTFTLPKKEKNY